MKRARHLFDVIHFALDAFGCGVERATVADVLNARGIEFVERGIGTRDIPREILRLRLLT